MITVGLDGRCLNTPHLRGMGKALLRLLDEAVADGGFAFRIFADEPACPLHAPGSPRVSSKVWEVPGHRFRAWEQAGLPWVARAARCDVLHAFGTWAPAWQPVPTVVTVHDVLPWREEPPSAYLTRVLPAAYRRAAAIVTPSESSARDIAGLWPELRDRITVIPWGIDARYVQSDTLPLPDQLAAQGVRPPYLLYFGGRIPRKRLDWAMQVWGRVAEHDSDLSLVVCGLEADAHAEWRDRAAAHLRDRLHCLDFVAEGDLPGLYAAAEAVLYPTLYEGFGFPALESQAVGTPVLMSAVGSLAELAGPGAVVLPPQDLGAWVAAVETIRRAGPRRDEAARQWARGFSWARAWRSLAEVYRRVRG